MLVEGADVNAVRTHCLGWCDSYLVSSCTSTRLGPTMSSRSDLGLNIDDASKKEESNLRLFYQQDLDGKAWYTGT